MSRPVNKNVPKYQTIMKVTADIAAVCVQLLGFLVWPRIGTNAGDIGKIWAIPIAVMLTSCGWWENFVSVRSPYSK